MTWSISFLHTKGLNHNLVFSQLKYLVLIEKEFKDDARLVVANARSMTQLRVRCFSDKIFALAHLVNNSKTLLIEHAGKIPLINLTTIGCLPTRNPSEESKDIDSSIFFLFFKQMR